MRDIQSFLTHYQRQRRWTLQIIEAIPEEHFHWTPSEQDFSLGDLVRHLIQSEVFWTRMLMEASKGQVYDPFDTVPGTPGRERLEAFRDRNLAFSRQDRLGSSFAACLESWRAVQARTESELSALGPEHFEVSVSHPLTGIQAPLWEMLLIMLEHEGHHRGQISAYLKVLGLSQPAVLATP